MSTGSRSSALGAAGSDFRYFLALRLAGNAAQQMLLVALAWQMYDLTSSAWDLGLVGLMQFLPALLLTIPAGQLADRVDRRRVLATSLGLQACVALALASGSVGDWVQRELILLASVVLGVARALQAPAQQALLPSLVPIVQLPQATAFSASVLQLAIIGGPALGGFFYALGPAVVYAVSCALAIAALGFSLALRARARPETGAPISWSSVFAGFRPRGMALTMGLAAAATAGIAVVVLILGWGAHEPPGLVGVVALIAVFAAMWLLASGLFAKARRYS
jgi:MFS family permease